MKTPLRATMVRDNEEMREKDNTRPGRRRLEVGVTKVRGHGGWKAHGRLLVEAAFTEAFGSVEAR